MPPHRLTEPSPKARIWLDWLASRGVLLQWRLADAKNRFSELVTLAMTEGPQFVRRRNDSVVVISLSEYRRMTGETPSFKDFLLAPGPSLEGLDLTRDSSPCRDVEL
ncbi:MAG: type II toxin-antitoxin system Phd/YefM family antitoxin [Vulcanimicrobiota bacterium]